MLKQYKNIDRINTAAKSVAATRFVKSKSDLFSYIANQTVIPNTDILTGTVDNRIEFHVYSNDTWISGNQNFISKSNPRI